MAYGSEVVVCGDDFVPGLKPPASTWRRFAPPFVFFVLFLLKCGQFEVGRGVYPMSLRDMGRPRLDLCPPATDGEGLLVLHQWRALSF